MQQRDRAIKVGLNRLCARSGEVNGTNLICGKFVVVVVIRASERTGKNKHSTKGNHLAHEISRGKTAEIQIVLRVCSHRPGRVKLGFGMLGANVGLST